MSMVGGDDTASAQHYFNEDGVGADGTSPDQGGLSPSGSARLPRLTRRRLLQGTGLVGLAGVGGAVAWALTRPDQDSAVSGGEGPPTDGVDPPPAAVGSPHDLDDFADNVQSGGPPRDGIPSIDDPVFVNAEAADFLDPDDIVFGHIVDGEPRAYPQLVLVWHEIVNERTSTGPMSVTYCPLTGSVVAFRPHAGIEEFGTSGNLVNSNLLMYDRTHESTWPQILAQAITGPQRGATLEEVPLEWTTWQRWREAFPQTVVLSPETGFVRRYGEDPYGTYTPLGGYYTPESDVIFPLMATGDQFAPKTVFLGAKLGDARLAVHKDLALAERVVPAEMDETPVVFLHDPALETARAFRAESAGRRLDLEPTDTAGEYVDRGSGAIWDSWGHPVAGSDGELVRIPSYDVMWFAWASFFPDTAVVT